jgi:hypothetical protein
MREASVQIDEQIARPLEALVAKGRRALTRHARRTALARACRWTAAGMLLLPLLAAIALLAGWIGTGMAWLAGVGLPVSLLLASWVRFSLASLPDRSTVLAHYDLRMQAADRLLSADQFLQQSQRGAFHCAALLDARPWVERALGLPDAPATTVVRLPLRAVVCPLLGLALLLLASLLPVAGIGTSAGRPSVLAAEVLRSPSALSAAAVVVPSATPAAVAAVASRSATTVSAVSVELARGGAASAAASGMARSSAVAAAVPGRSAGQAASSDAGSKDARSGAASAGAANASAGQASPSAAASGAGDASAAGAGAGDGDSGGREGVGRELSSTSAGAAATAASPASRSESTGRQTSAAPKQEPSAPNNRSQSGDGRQGHSGGSNQGDGQGQQGAGEAEGIKLTRGISGLMLGVPMEDRLRGTPNAGRIRQRMEPATDASPASLASAQQMRGSAGGDSGPLTHTTASAAEQRLVRDYFLRQRERADDLSQGAQ